MDIKEPIGGQSRVPMPRTGVLGEHGRAISQATSIKVSIGEEGDIRVHSVLDAEELDSIGVGLLDALEETLLVGKQRGRL